MPRHLLLIPLVAVLAFAGCRQRGDAGAGPAGGEEAPMAPADAGLQAQLDAANAKIADLQTSLDAARKNMGGGGTLATIAGGDIEGFERTASGGVALPEDFAFAKGSAQLNPEGEKAITRLAERLNQGENADKNITVKGYTDDTPVSRASTKEKYVDNWGLSAARASAVVRALEKAGVASERLTGAFRGQLDPRASGGGKDDKARNRRVEIYLSSK